MLFKPLMPFVEYIVDYDYISTVLCINKEKPELKCNGKCHLMKELAKSAEDEKPISEKKSSVKEIEILFFQELTQLNFPNPKQNTKPLLNWHYANLYHYQNSDAAFHPPAIII